MNEHSNAKLPLPANWPEGFDAAPSILLVDDEANILSSLRRLLRPTGYLILNAESGEKALEVLQNEPVDVIISDMRMPGITGAKLLDEVRQRWPWTIRILLTGYAEVSCAIAAINQGEVYRYISKPWDDNELLMTIRRAVERRGLEKDHKRLLALTEQQNQELIHVNECLEEKVTERTQALAKSHEELTHAHEQIKKNFLMSIRVFSNLIEMRIQGLAGHSRRVAELGHKIALHMGLPRGVSQSVMIAGLLHGIGKIGFPDSLILKPLSQLDQQESELFKKHPEKGAAALIGIDELRGAADIIKQQHEYYDGSGFPFGLAGDVIHEGASALAIAMDYDAVQLGLRIPQKLTAKEAENWIINFRGTHYLPKSVDAFIAVLHPEDNRIAKTEFIGRGSAS